MRQTSTASSSVRMARVGITRPRPSAECGSRASTTLITSRTLTSLRQSATASDDRCERTRDLHRAAQEDLPRDATQTALRADNACIGVLVSWLTSCVISLNSEPVFFAVGRFALSLTRRVRGMQKKGRIPRRRPRAASIAESLDSVTDEAGDEPVQGNLQAGGPGAQTAEKIDRKGHNNF
jgi:hypothetical protein